MKKKIILGNFGVESLALIQWAYECNFSNIVLCYFNTGWAGAQWSEIIALGKKLLVDYKYQFIELSSEVDFPTSVIMRGSFPNHYAQWCVSFLKAAPFINWLDEVDVNCCAEVWLGYYREKSRAYANLSEYKYASEHFDGRDLRYPLFEHSKQEILDLAKKTKVPFFTHRSLECDPCVNNCVVDFQRMNHDDLQKVQQLEQKINMTMFEQVKSGDNSIEDIVKWAQLQPKETDAEQFDMHCGSLYGCGT